MSGDATPKPVDFRKAAENAVREIPSLSLLPQQEGLAVIAQAYATIALVDAVDRLTLQLARSAEYGVSRGESVT